MTGHGHRFDRTALLLGPEGFARLERAHVMIIGVGGVGSWAAEMTARAGTGRLTLVDFDTVCTRNFNRQLQALDGNVGRPKAEVLAERLRLINPAARVDAVNANFGEQTCPEIMKDRPDFVIDAIDNVTAKCWLINHCRSTGIPMIVSTGSGGRRDPTQVRVTDLGLTEMDPLARAVRGILRDKYGFPKKGKFKVQAVCSLEQPAPAAPGETEHCGARCAQCEGPAAKKNVLGTAGFVTGAFGMACASAAVSHIASGGAA